jgi:phage gpG-like protein
MLTINAAQAIAELNAILARTLNTEPALAVIGRAAVEAARHRIQATKTGPEGNHWTEWRQATRDHREAKGNVGRGLLWDDGTLLDSIHVEQEAGGIEIGSDLEYGAFLQEGTERMVARPWLGWDDDLARHAEMTMLHYIETGTP